MGTVEVSIGRWRRLAVTGTCSIALMVGLAAGPASAQDQHSGGSSPNDEEVDPGQIVRGPSPAGLPRTGTDVAGLVALGAGAAAVGTGALAVSKRRARRTA